MKKPFRFLIFLLLCMPFAQASADARSDGLLEALSSKIASMGNYRVEFTVQAEENTVEGEYVVSRDRYYMEVGQSEVVCDGKVKYEINHADKEIIADRVDPDDKSIFSNPTRAFDFAPDQFTHEYMGESVENGVRCDVVLLTPKEDGSGITGITLAIDRERGVPVLLKYDADGLSDEIHISIDSFTPDPGAEDSLFGLDRKKYKDYELIDFR